MSNEPDENLDGELAEEYDFSGGQRGKHSAALRDGYKIIVHKGDGTTEEHALVLPEGVILLDPDLREAFPSSDAVNRTLRGLLELVPSKRVAS